MFDDKLDRPPDRDVRAGRARASGCEVLVELDYELNEGGPLRAVADLIFIRRALRDSIRRTLQRFAVEAAEEAALSASAVAMRARRARRVS